MKSVANATNTHIWDNINHHMTQWVISHRRVISLCSFFSTLFDRFLHWRRLGYNKFDDFYGGMHFYDEIKFSINKILIYNNLEVGRVDGYKIKFLPC